ncbi:MAG TPA: zinc ribbon domain-containing protein [Anaerolineae bacterium]|nr:zinc ribbon domain-containing protein [Caldilineae bacterium]HID35156.1 zinc ribbon domain-containing protein [Anaerolineae bacterium]
MLCPHCGKENPDGAEVCQHCGEPLPPAGQPPRLLSQIQGLIPAEPVITLGERRAPDHPAPLHQLPTIPPAPVLAARPEPDVGSEDGGVAPRAPERERNVALWTLAGASLLLILLGSIWNGLAPLPAPVRPSVKNAYAFIEILPIDANVLVAWDYDPATQGEMQLLAQPILHHLQRKQVNMVFMSLRPFGPEVAADAQALTASLAPGAALVAPSPTQLGYIPGESIALRALALSPVIASNRPRLSAQEAGMRPTQNIDAFDLLIQITAEMNSSREWVEQVASRSNAPLIVAASGGAAPLLRPYEQTGQIRVLLAGYPDALAYEQLLGQAGPATQQATSQALLTIFFLGVVLFAALRSLLRPDH